jgi:hypothetical protein
MKVILPVRDVPLGLFVTKKTGEKQYVVMDKIAIHGETKSEYREIKADGDSRFLVTGTNIAAVSGDLEVLWETDPSYLYQFIYDKYISEHQ